MLKGKVALVTGASRGIGAAVARLLGANHARVAVNYHTRADLAEAVLADIRRGGSDGLTIAADVTEPAAVGDMVRRVERELGPVDVLVNNANMPFPVPPFVEYPWDAFERKLVFELRASFHTCQAVAASMIACGGGCIVNVSSGLSRDPGPGFVAHSSAKAALDAFSRGLALELGPNGIRFNVGAPGLTRTDATAHQPREMHESVAQRTPLRRIAEPDDIAGAVLFYCVDWARFITGTYLPVCGGSRMG